MKTIFDRSDEVRDVELPPLGVKLEDKGEKGYQWKYISDIQTLLKEKEAEKS